MVNVQELTRTEESLLVKSGESASLSHQDDAPEPANPKEVAEYCATLLEQIRTMAGRSGHTFLAYLVQTALEEAKIQAGEMDDI